jgi:pilus assembly protein CpaE
MSEALTVLIIDADPDARSAIQSAVSGVPGASVIAETDSPLYGYELIRQNRPKVVFLDLSGDPEKNLALAQRISSFFKDVLIVASKSFPPTPTLPLQGGGDQNQGAQEDQKLELEMLKACMEAGIREVLDRPLDAGLIRAIFEKHRLALSTDQQDGDRTGRILTVFSNKGGLGKTTIAVNLALALSEAVGKPVALVDLNFQLGDITTFLDVEPKQTIVDVARNIGRVDAAYLEGSLAQYSTDRARLYVLADPLQVEDAEELTADQINAVLTVLRATFEYVVIDTTPSFDAKTLCALDLADYILMVSIVNLPSIRSSQRLFNLFERLGYPAQKIKLILNRYMPDEEITLEDVEETLEHPVFWKIPNSYYVVMTAINRGIPIAAVEGGQALHKSFLELGRLLSGVLPSTAKPEESTGNTPGKPGPAKPETSADKAPPSLLTRMFPSFFGSAR